MAGLNVMQKNPSENEQNQLFREKGFTAVKVVIWKSKLERINTWRNGSNNAS